MIDFSSQVFYKLDQLNTYNTKLAYQLSSGKKLNNGSDDANLHTRLIYVDDKIRVYEGLKIQIEKTSAQNNVSDSTLKEIKNLLAYVKKEVIKALNGTTSNEAKTSIAVNLEGIKKNLFSMSNEEVEGEYLYAGSNSMIKAFEQDSNGKISYTGDQYLRETAVDYNSYRQKGVTGVDIFMYNSSSALKNETLTFDAKNKIFDQDGNEWKFSTTNLPNANDGIITKYDKDGITSETLSASSNGNTPLTYDVVIPNIDGNKFEAKHSTFDLMDKIINALKNPSTTGKDLTEGLAEISDAYSSANIAHAKLGGRNKVFEMSLERVSIKLTQFHIFSQRIGQADISKVAVESKALELTYAALYSTISKMNQMSLVNFLK